MGSVLLLSGLEGGSLLGRCFGPNVWGGTFIWCGQWFFGRLGRLGGLGGLSGLSGLGLGLGLCDQRGQWRGLGIVDSSEFLKRGVAQFDRLYAESADTTRIMAISLHPYVSGVPHRIGYLEELYRYITSKPGVNMWTGEQILDWYKENCLQTESAEMARQAS